MRVLFVNSAWGWQVDEGREVEETLLGLLAGLPAETHAFGSDGRRVFAVGSEGGQLQTADLGGWQMVLRMPLDVAYVPIILPPLRQLSMAALLRLRGIKVVCSPLGFLGRNFATTSWFRPANSLQDRAKRVKVALLRRSWRLVANHFLCASRNEVQQADLPAERCSLAPWPAPRSGLADAARDRETEGASDAPSPKPQPIALVSRFDPYRKGFDRLERWLLTYEQELPKPALKVFSPRPPKGGGLQELSRTGLVEWDPDTRGEALVSALRSCSGTALLSRWEGQPRALREAVLFGLPVITTPSANFTEVIEVLGCGAVVDGDRPDEIHAAFLQLGTEPHSPSEAKLLFDRDRIGAFLWEVFSAVARGRTPPHSYYQQLGVGVELSRDPESDT